jgi:hypothetical protein
MSRSSHCRILPCVKARSLQFLPDLRNSGAFQLAASKLRTRSNLGRRDRRQETPGGTPIPTALVSRRIEEKIDQIIDSKRQLSQDLLEGGAEVLLTEMQDDDLLKLVALDLHTASEE